MGLPTSNNPNRGARGGPPPSYPTQVPDTTTGQANPSAPEHHESRSALGRDDPSDAPISIDIRGLREQIIANAGQIRPDVVTEHRRAYNTFVPVRDIFIITVRQIAPYSEYWKAEVTYNTCCRTGEAMTDSENLESVASVELFGSDLPENRTLALHTLLEALLEETVKLVPEPHFNEVYDTRMRPLSRT